MRGPPREEVCNSVLDRLGHAAHQIVIKGPSYRAKLAPKRRQAPTTQPRFTLRPFPGQRVIGPPGQVRMR